MRDLSCQLLVNPLFSNEVGPKIQRFGLKEFLSANRQVFLFHRWLGTRLGHSNWSLTESVIISMQGKEHFAMQGGAAEWGST